MIQILHVYWTLGDLTLYVTVVGRAQWPNLLSHIDHSCIYQTLFIYSKNLCNGNLSNGSRVPIVTVLSRAVTFDEEHSRPRSGNDHQSRSERV